jgi:hypothetical protein
MKTCYKCQKTLPPSDFYPSVCKPDGLSSMCRVCHRAWRRGHYQKYKAETEATKAKWAARNPEKVKAIIRAKSKRRYPAMKGCGLTRVYRKVSFAVSTGKLQRGPCVVCGSENSVAHHEDYSKPLDVVWYCQLHHAELHEKTGSRLHTLPGYSARRDSSDISAQDPPS